MSSTRRTLRRRSPPHHLQRLGQTHLQRSGSRRSSVPEHLHPARRKATPPWPDAPATSRSSIADSAISRTPAKGETSRALLGATNKAGTADPRRSSVGAAPSEEETTAAKGHSGNTTTSPAPPASTPPHTPRLCTHRDPSIPRPPAAEAAAGGRGIARIAGGELVRAVSPKKSPFYCRWGKGDEVQALVRLFDLI